MYGSTIITIKSNHFVYTFIALFAARCCWRRQVTERQAVANGGLNWSAGRTFWSAGRTLATHELIRLAIQLSLIRPSGRFSVLCIYIDNLSLF